jgi:hypothetical protein
LCSSRAWPGISNPARAQHNEGIQQTALNLDLTNERGRLQSNDRSNSDTAEKVAAWFLQGTRTLFGTPYCVIDYHACNSCWNDTGIEFDNKNYLWCPAPCGHRAAVRMLTADYAGSGD